MRALSPALGSHSDPYPRLFCGLSLSWGRAEEIVNSLRERRGPEQGEAQSPVEDSRGWEREAHREAENARLGDKA